MPADTARIAARLVLADGSVYRGLAFGDASPRVVEGEACFNTSLSGYQEVLTDPSYAGQIVAMTATQIGNYGVNEDDLESTKAQVAGFVVRELSPIVSNHRATASLSDWLADQGVLGITGVDTRALTRTLRVEGAMNAALCSDASVADEELWERAKAAVGVVDQNLVRGVSRTQASAYSSDLGGWRPLQGEVEPVTKRRRVVAIDCGAKLNILRNLVDAGCDVTVAPWDATPEEILEHRPDGLFISNGPGDPSAVDTTIQTLKQLQGQVPTFGICLGHQLLGLSMGARTFKLKFGHRGGNQPVQNLHTGKVEITSQNHGFAVDPESLEAAGGEPTHINLNDRTLEGFRHRELPLFAVQYHPEAAPGPHDSRYLFDCFLTMMDTGRAPTGEDMDRAQRRRNRVG